jgi:hypothetical protein
MKSIWRVNPYGPQFWPSDTAREAEKKLGVTDLYEPLLRKDGATGKYVKNDLQVNPQYAKDISGHFNYRLYYDPSWDSDINAASIVAKTANAYNLVGGYCKGVMWDIEYHRCDDLIIDIIDAWRAVYPKGPIGWTMEPWQGGWMTTPLVNKINSDVNMVVVVQNFYYNMSPAGTRIINGKVMDARQDLIRRGFASNRVKWFYDGAKSIPSTWDGCILSEETLPSYNLP